MNGLETLIGDGIRQVLVPLAFFLSVAAIFILRGPLGRALADRVGRRGSGVEGPAATRAELDDLQQRVADLEDTRARLHELEERVDFTERMLAQQRERAALPPGT